MLDDVHQGLHPSWALDGMHQGLHEGGMQKDARGVPGRSQEGCPTVFAVECTPESRPLAMSDGCTPDPHQLVIPRNRRK